MFERFTDRARRVVVLCQEEARLLEHSYIGTEHVLLGLIHEGEGVASQVLRGLGIELEATRNKVHEMIGAPALSPDDATMATNTDRGLVHIPFTPRTKKVFELSLREALQLGHNYIGTEHILLALIREGEGIGAQVLVALGADLSTARHEVIATLSGYAGGPRESVTLTFSAAAADALIEWVGLFDGTNGPLAKHHPLLLLHQELRLARIEQAKAG